MLSFNDVQMAKNWAISECYDQQDNTDVLCQLCAGLCLRLNFVYYVTFWGNRYEARIKE